MWRASSRADRDGRSGVLPGRVKGACLFGALIGASASVAHEIRTGTALAVLSKPVGRAGFIVAKYLGLAAALTVLTYVNAVSALMASRMTFDAYGDPDLPALAIYLGGLALAYLAAAFSNFFLRRPFVSDAVFRVMVVATLAFIIAINFTQQVNRISGVTEVDSPAQR